MDELKRDAAIAAAEEAEDGKNAICIPEDAAALAAALEIAWADPGKVRALGQRAQEELYLSWEAAVGQARERYGAVLEDWRSRQGKRQPGLRRLLKP